MPPVAGSGGPFNGGQPGAMQGEGVYQGTNGIHLAASPQRELQLVRNKCAISLKSLVVEFAQARVLTDRLELVEFCHPQAQKTPRSAVLQGTLRACSRAYPSDATLFRF